MRIAIFKETPGAGFYQRFSSQQSDPPYVMKSGFSHFRFEAFRKAFGCKQPEVCYNPNFDHNKDGAIGGRDYGILLQVPPDGDYSLMFYVDYPNDGSCISNFPGLDSGFYDPLKELYQGCITDTGELYRGTPYEYSFSGPAKLGSSGLCQ